MKKIRFRPGVSFADFVARDFSVTRGRVREAGPRDFRRGWLLWLMMATGLGLLLIRLVVLQVMESGKFRVLADENRVRREKIVAPRGKIVDRNGEVLAGNEEVGGWRWRRHYPLGEVTSHVVGYLSEVGEEEVGLLKSDGRKYGLGDWVGRMGLEQAMEEVLRGVDGGRLVEVDIGENLVRELGVKAPEPGQDARTSLDAELSRVAYQALKGRKGAVVASVPKTGEVLVLVSSPGFDPNVFVSLGPQAVDADKVRQVLDNPELPMFNRAISGVYPPGSPFKMITTVAAIESGKVKPEFTFNDPGVMVVAGFRYTNWLFTKNGGREGEVGLVKALARSTDTFYYKLGEILGPRVMGEWADKFGLGRATGIEIAGEAGGVIASPEYKERSVKEPWFLGNSYHMAIGQGDTLVTPLQMNLVTDVIANRGKKCRPRLLKAEARGQDCGVVEVSQLTWELVYRGMVDACRSGGTAFPMFDWNDAAANGQSQARYSISRTGKPLPVVACKTGTAEYAAGRGKMRTHAWLTAFAPVDDPQISVTALLEGGGEGSSAAAPVVRQVLAKYFDVEDSYPYERIRQTGGE